MDSIGTNNKDIRIIKSVKQSSFSKLIFFYLILYNDKDTK